MLYVVICKKENWVQLTFCLVLVCGDSVVILCGDSVVICNRNHNVEHLCCDFLEITVGTVLPAPRCVHGLD